MKLLSRFLGVILCGSLLVACGTDSDSATNNTPSPPVQNVSPETADFIARIGAQVWHGKIDGVDCIVLSRRFSTYNWHNESSTIAMSCNWNPDGITGAK
jgi:hypothetical protein